jgi:hypothetical protein
MTAITYLIIAPAYLPRHAKSAFDSSGYLLHVNQKIPLKDAESIDVEVGKCSFR